MTRDIPPLTIGSEVVEPGERRVVQLPVANLYTDAAVMHLPVHAVHGRRPGPKLMVSAAIHGDELIGVEIIRRLLKQRSLRSLRGTLIAIPVVNGFGMIQHSRYLPDRRDLNRSFPGSERGSLAARLAHIFFESIVKQCSYGVDIHTGSGERSNLPQIRANLDDAETRALARAFGVPVLINARLRDASLREAATQHGIKMLVYEAGEALRFEELGIRAGVSGVLRLMRFLEMLPPRKGGKPLPEPFIARSTSWVRAPSSGVLSARIRLGDHVVRDQLLATISDPSDFFGGEEEEVRAARGGVVIGRTSLPLVNEGDALYHIARFEDSGEVASEVATFRQDLADPDRP